MIFRLFFFFLEKKVCAGVCSCLSFSQEAWSLWVVVVVLAWRWSCRVRWWARLENVRYHGNNVIFWTTMIPVSSGFFSQGPHHALQSGSNRSGRSGAGSRSVSAGTDGGVGMIRYVGYFRELCISFIQPSHQELFF